jgi:hypothetical protein
MAKNLLNIFSEIILPNPRNRETLLSAFLHIQNPVGKAVKVREVLASFFLSIGGFRAGRPWGARGPTPLVRVTERRGGDNL